MQTTKAAVAGTTNAVAAAVSSSSIISPPPRWKVALWEKNSIEPAMLRVPIVLIVFIFLWGLNIITLDRARMPYQSVLSIKNTPLLFIFVLGGTLAITYAINMTLFSNMMGLSVELGVSLFYALLLVLVMIPGVPGQDKMSSFYRLCKQVLFPHGSVTFPEVLLADAFCSLSKIFKDIGVTMIAIYAQASGKDIVSLHDTGMILVAILASAPFWIRIRQCMVQLDSTNDFIAKVPITLNLLKYASAFPPIWLAAAASLGYSHPDLPIIAAAMATINSVFSYGWDICMDWGMITFFRTGKILTRQRLLLPWIIYPPAIIINLLLRFSWAANRIPSLSHLHASHLILLVELGEVMRRAMWNVLRIEWEVIVQQERLSDKDEEGRSGSNSPIRSQSAGLLK